eukprot:GILJ01024102.1.p1 GENE.GILJ01024102.1~~GILJ01024102.1.p1  ORF type:complete len:611 (+),score=30.49 GILJ01024102.1:206-2038(+)
MEMHWLVKRVHFCVQEYLWGRSWNRVLHGDRRQMLQEAINRQDVMCITMVMLYHPCVRRIQELDVRPLVSHPLFLVIVRKLHTEYRWCRSTTTVRTTLSKVAGQGNISHFKSICLNYRFLMSDAWDLECGFSMSAVAAAKHGHFKIVKWIHKYYHTIWSTDTMYDVLRAATKGGHLDIVRYAVETHEERVSQDVFDKAFESGNMDLIRYILVKSPDVIITPSTLARAVRHIEVLEWGFRCLRTSPVANLTTFYPLLWMACAEHNAMHTIRWLQDNQLVGFGNSYDNMIHCALTHGHLEMAQWLYHQDPSTFNVTSTLIYEICRSGRLDVVKWVVAHSTSPIEFTWEYFHQCSFSRNVQLVEWMMNEVQETPNHDNNIGINNLIRQVIKNNHEIVFKKILECWTLTDENMQIIVRDVIESHKWNLFRFISNPVVDGRQLDHPLYRACFNNDSGEIDQILALGVVTPEHVWCLICRHVRTENIEALSSLLEFVKINKGGWTPNEIHNCIISPGLVDVFKIIPHEYWSTVGPSDQNQYAERCLRHGRLEIFQHIVGKVGYCPRWTALDIAHLHIVKWLYDANVYRDWQPWIDVVPLQAGYVEFFNWWRGLGPI